MALFPLQGAEGEPVASPFVLNSENISISSANRSGVYEDGLLIDEVTKHQEVASVWFSQNRSRLRIGPLIHSRYLSFQPTASRLWGIRLAKLCSFAISAGQYSTVTLRLLAIRCTDGWQISRTIVCIFEHQILIPLYVPTRISRSLNLLSPRRICADSICDIPVRKISPG